MKKYLINQQGDFMMKITQNSRMEVTKFMLAYKFALDEVGTKISILQEEFRLIHDYNPIEHVSKRIKSPASILKKIEKKNVPLRIEEVEASIRDIAGIRITCSFEEDIYRVSEMLQAQRDLEVVEIKDYIKQPKGNGYRSLHLIVKIPIFLSDREKFVPVEIQIRTIAMDFWASLEHKIYYKYNKDIPQHIKNGLKEAAEQVNALDEKMARLNEEINILKERDGQHQSDIDFSRFVEKLKNVQ